MTTKLDRWLTANPKKAERFHERIGVSRMALGRYRKRLRIPKETVMIKIVVESKGAIMPNDFYDIPARYLATAPTMAVPG